MAYKKSSETRERILKAAERLFSERGYYDSSVDDIAREAGLGRPSVYYYFADKERIARALFDAYADGIYADADRALGDDPDLFLRTLVKYLLLFKRIALNKATQAVFYDLVRYSDYDAENIERLKRTVFRDVKRMAAAYGARLTDKRLVALIQTSDACAKAMFKGILNGTLEFSLEEAMDYFCRHALLPDVPVPEAEYRRKLKQAFKLCEAL